MTLYDYYVCMYVCMYRPESSILKFLYLPHTTDFSGLAFKLSNSSHNTVIEPLLGTKYLLAKISCSWRGFRPAASKIFVQPWKRTFLVSLAPAFPASLERGTALGQTLAFVFVRLSGTVRGCLEVAFFPAAIC